jgi:hypothetical protein
MPFSYSVSFHEHHKTTSQAMWSCGAHGMSELVGDLSTNAQVNRKLQMMGGTTRGAAPWSYPAQSSLADRKR